MRYAGRSGSNGSGRDRGYVDRLDRLLLHLRLDLRLLPCELWNGDERRQLLVLHGDLVRQAPAVLGIPRGGMGAVEHSVLAALGLADLAVLAGGDDDGLVVGKQNCVRPLLKHRRDAGLLAVDELQAPAVVCAHLVWLLELADDGMCGHHHVAAALAHLAQQVQQLSEALGDVGVALAVAGVLDALKAHGTAHVVDRELLRPVGGVQNERASAFLGEVTNPRDLFKQHLPARGRGKARDVQVVGRALGIDEQRVRELSRQRRLSDALGAVDDDLLGAEALTAGDLECH